MCVWQTYIEQNENQQQYYSLVTRAVLSDVYFDHIEVQWSRVNTGSVQTPGHKWLSHSHTSVHRHIGEISLICEESGRRRVHVEPRQRIAGLAIIAW